MSSQSQKDVASTSNTRTAVSHASNMLVKFFDFYEKEEFCDTVVISEIDTIKIKAHKVILSASSEYFRVLFRNPLKGITSDEVQIKGIDGTTLTTIIKFMYSGRIELCNETVECIIKTAHFFQMDSLIAVCCDFMADQIDVGNCLGVANFADQYAFTSLAEKTFVFACKNFQNLSDEKEFLDMNEEQLCSFISRDILQIESEEKLFLIVKSWVDHDKDNREKLIDNLLKHIRFTSLAPQFITDTIKVGCTTVESHALVDKWIQWHAEPEKRSELALEEKQPRENFEILDLTQNLSYQSPALTLRHLLQRPPTRSLNIN